MGDFGRSLSFTMPERAPPLLPPEPEPLPEELEEGTAFPVRKYHIDTNEHVNNCQYVQMALETLGEELLVRKVSRVQRSAVLGDMIYPRTAREEERTVVELCNAEGKPYAVMELTGEKRC